MSKTIKINDKSYEIDYNALAYVNHMNNFNKGILEDASEIQDFLTEQIVIEETIRQKNPTITDEEMSRELSKFMLKKVDKFIYAVLRITYTGINCVNSNFNDFEEWVREIKDINTNDKWIVEVTKLVVSKFC